MSKFPPTAVPAQHFDSGLHCPVCHYNLTGLVTERCPECGSPFDRDQLFQALGGPAPVHFERLRGWWRPLGFVISWITVLFLPWIFARQAVQRVSVRAGWGFGAVCFVGTSIALLIEAEWAVYAAWMAAAVVYVLLQTILLTTFDPAPVNRWRAGLAFWLAISGYTSAVMVTEILTGPPLVFFSDLIRFVFGPTSWVGEALTSRAYQLSGLYPYVEWMYDGQSLMGLLQWGQMFLWLAGVVCCFYARLRQARHHPFRAVVSSGAVALLLLLLYSAVAQIVGFPVFEALVVRF